MKIRNVWKNTADLLEIHKDDRGTIADIFYNQNIEHVTVIDSKPNVLRGNHYHKQSTQHMLMTKGSLEYWYKPTGSDEPAQMVVAEVGDLVSTPPYETHALIIGPDGNQFIVFSEGLRGGTDYELDTYRVDSIIPE